MRNRTVLGLLVAAAALALPSAARADDAFCNALRHVIETARWDMNSLANRPHNIPGSIQEHRGTAMFGGEPHAVFTALMLSEPAAQARAHIAPRFAALHAQIAHCIPDAQGGQVEQLQGWSRAIWTLPRALVQLRRQDGEGFASTAEIEIAVATRW
jgi:hypothetical protein